MLKLKGIGGTNFGWWAGANAIAQTYDTSVSAHATQEEYRSVITSYDYGAPLGETGEQGHGSDGNKFQRIKWVISQYASWEIPTLIRDEEAGQEELLTRKENSARFRNSSFADNSTWVPLRMETAVPLFENLGFFANKTMSGIVKPGPMEIYGQSFGLIMYEKNITILPHGDCTAPVLLSIPRVSDRAQVFVDGNLIGVIDRNVAQNVSLEIPYCKDLEDRGKGQEVLSSQNENSTGEEICSLLLQILVENMGRINYGINMWDPKGILDPGVLLNGIPLVAKEINDTNEKSSCWVVYSLPFDEQISQLYNTNNPFSSHSSISRMGKNDGLKGQTLSNSTTLRQFRQQSPHSASPVLFQAWFPSPPSSSAVFEEEKTAKGGGIYLDLRCWGKGVAWVNGRPLGRYWGRGPQQALWVPGPYLHGWKPTSKNWTTLGSTNDDKGNIHDDNGALWLQQEQKNELLILELEQPRLDLTVEFSSYPIANHTVLEGCPNR
eukprot:CAMPEP_0194566428 /NCGR_PEP_ID=MMETSP0292-20121207/5321_1 /TAXON_ID=39354 /ORGANISM="Heterosigma akashiwo, Strain CCMP2393" /LENGTH=492 /DNA_ID=CAMNT_0039416023 /DNA_START=233 /DNA_END=1712 /DNA_ORIENTATION=-